MQHQEQEKVFQEQRHNLMEEIDRLKHIPY